MSRWSSYKEQQQLHEGWRRFLNEAEPLGGGEPGMPRGARGGARLAAKDPTRYQTRFDLPLRDQVKDAVDGLLRRLNVPSGEQKIDIQKNLTNNIIDTGNRWGHYVRGAERQADEVHNMVKDYLLHDVDPDASGYGSRPGEGDSPYIVKPVGHAGADVYMIGLNPEMEHPGTGE